MKTKPIELNIENITGYIVHEGEYGTNRIEVVRRKGFDGLKWSAMWSGNCIGKDLSTELEPQPSSRSDRFKKEYRFSFEEAVEIAEKFKTRFLSNLLEKLK